MSSNLTDRSAFRIGAFRVDPTRNVLSVNGIDHVIEPRVMEVMCALADRGNDVAARQELIDEIWAVHYGADEGLTRAISVLRKTIREAGEDSTYIETIPKRGYRLVQPVTMGTAMDDQFQSPTPTDTLAPSRSGLTAFVRRFWPLVAGVAGFIALFLLVSVLRPPGVDTPIAENIAEQSDTVPAIAVLPFRPMSDAPQDLHFGDGVAEELLHRFARIPDLHVAARTSAFTFRGDTVPINEIGARLNVDYVLEGSVRREGDRVRVTAQLIRVSDGFHLWSETFDRELTNIFDVQDEITRKIAQALQIRLGVGVGSNVRVRADIDAAAVEHYYRALYQWSNRFTEKDGMREPFDSLRQAVLIEPDFADAWAAIGYYGTIADAGPAANNRESHTQMTVEALERAVSIDPENWLAHVGLGRWHSESDIDVAKAIHHRDLALSLAPSALETLGLRAKISWVLGDVEDALNALREARQLDPLNPALNVSYAMELAEAGQFLEAFEVFDECQRTQCAQAGFIPYATWAAQMSGDPEILARWEPLGREFLTALERIPPAQKPKHTQLLPAVFAVWFDDPDKDERIAEAIAILRAQRLTDGFSYWAPTLSPYLPDDLMLDMLELAHERRDLLSSAYAMHPFMSEHTFPDTILQHPRYHALWSQPGLSELAAARREAGWPQGLPR